MSEAVSEGASPQPIRESLWPARFAILAIVVLQLLLNERVTPGPSWLLPGLELLLLLPLSTLRAAQRRQLHRYGHLLLPSGRTLPRTGVSRLISFVLIGLLSLANLLSLLLLVRALLHGSKATGTLLLIDALNIWATNIIVFALWYWELDRGGPLRRGTRREGAADFLYPQMVTPQPGQDWHPSFMDYLYVAFTNATAFSPTDTMPLSRQAKLLMMLQSGISLLTIALVASRAVNILA